MGNDKSRVITQHVSATPTSINKGKILKLDLDNSVLSNLSLNNCKSISHKTEISSVMSSVDYHRDYQKFIIKPKTTIIQREIRNGIIGKYLSLSIAEVAYIFWEKHITPLEHKEKLEIGCSIFFTMMSSNDSLKRVLKNSLKGIKIEKLSFQFLDMLGWLIRHLLVDNIDLYSTFTLLGKTHKAMGVHRAHFQPMLNAIHETFGYYFDHQRYSIKEKYAINKIFSVASQIMTGEKLIKLGDVGKALNDLNFLQSLNICLSSTVGIAYLNLYLQDMFCDELVIWIKQYKRYKSAVSDKERFMIAKNICKTLIEPTAPFTINISYETRTSTLALMKLLKNKFSECLNDDFKISPMLFDNCNDATQRLLEQNHWDKFKKEMNTLKQSSNIDIN